MKHVVIIYLFIYLFIYLEVQRVHSAIGSNFFLCKQGDIVLDARP